MTEELSSPPPTVQEVLESIEREWNALQAVFSKLEIDQMTSPGAEGWSVKDELAHLAAWARGVAALVRKQRRYTRQWACRRTQHPIPSASSI